MKKKIFLLSLVVLCFGFFPILKTAADTVYNTIFTSAEATREVAPDMAILNFSIENTDKNSQNALEANKTASSKVLSALKNISTENDNIRTSDFAMYPNYSSKDRNHIDSYTCKTVLRVEVSQLDKIGKFIDTAIANGAKRVAGIDFKLKNHQQICNELYPEVMQNALNQAKIVAKSLNSQVLGAKKINVSCYAQYENNYRTYATNAKFASSSYDEASGNSLSIEPGKIKVRANVNGDFQIK